MLSNGAIRQMQKEGDIRITASGAYGPLKYGAASVDLHLADLRVLPAGGHSNAVLRQNARNALYNPYLSLDILASVKEENDAWILEPNKAYVATLDESVESEAPYTVFSRSSFARLGVQITDAGMWDHSEENLRHRYPPKKAEHRHWILITTLGTRARLPLSLAPAQATFEEPAYDHYGLRVRERHLDADELLELSDDDIMIDGKPLRESERVRMVEPRYPSYDSRGQRIHIPSTVSIPVTMHETAFFYDKRSVLDPTQDNSAAFEQVDLTKPRLVDPGHFFIGSTREKIGMKRHAAFLEEGQWLADPLLSHRLSHHPDHVTHATAPHQWPSPAGEKTLVTENILLAYARLKAGQPTGRIFFKNITGPLEGDYRTRYEGQDGPQLNRPDSARA